MFIKLWLTFEQFHETASENTATGAFWETWRIGSALLHVKTPSLNFDATPRLRLFMHLYEHHKWLASVWLSS
jgi:uncharacterized membrane protein YwaF